MPGRTDFVKIANLYLRMVAFVEGSQKGDFLLHSPENRGNPWIPKVTKKTLCPGGSLIVNNIQERRTLVLAIEECAYIALTRVISPT